ncbi:MAG TPA: hypothetical protein VJ912_02230 [Candidatus Nanoarchaeia archaeon]|nr:hypothetical protein [Candidatus Nanoarchaeia archaeon]
MSQEKRFIKEKTRSGNVVTLDTDEKKCLEVGGFKPGQRIIFRPDWFMIEIKATVKGVAKNSYKLEVLWILIDGDCGVSHVSNSEGDALLRNRAKAIGGE